MSRCWARWVADESGFFARHIFPWALAANPSDAFRVFNMAMSDSVALATGIGAERSAVPLAAVLGALLAWPALALALAYHTLKKVEP